MSARSSIPAATDATSTPTEPGGPVRMCIGCRVRERITELLRVVAVNGFVVPDLRRRLPGRGAWLHPDEGCLDAAERRRAFGRALRVAGPLDTSRVRGLLRKKASDGVRDRPAARGGSSSRQ
ncbi:MAG TPA: YlxR family protein [Nakamurella sp.]|nr:YlxR family protein [Nakamurella sp.]